MAEQEARSAHAQAPELRGSVPVALPPALSAAASMAIGHAGQTIVSSNSAPSPSAPFEALSAAAASLTPAHSPAAAATTAPLSAPVPLNDLGGLLCSGSTAAQHDDDQVAVEQEEQQQQQRGATAALRDLLGHTQAAHAERLAATRTTHAHAHPHQRALAAPPAPPRADEELAPAMHLDLQQLLDAAALHHRQQQQQHRQRRREHEHSTLTRLHSESAPIHCYAAPHGVCARRGAAASGEGCSAAGGSACAGCVAGCGWAGAFPFGD